jgi:hypothetical protein
MAQQTAVDWLFEQINGYAYPLPFDRNIRIDISKEIIEQAKEMEKNQIIDAVRSECIYSNRQEIAEKYYEDNFIKGT